MFFWCATICITIVHCFLYDEICYLSLFFSFCSAHHVRNRLHSVNYCSIVILCRGIRNKIFSLILKDFHVNTISECDCFFAWISLPDL